MSEQSSPTAHAPARDQAGNRTALLIVDMINCFDFPGSETLRPQAKRAALAILALRRQADDAEIPVVYVNDNFGQWHSEKSRLIEHARDRLVETNLLPRDRDYFIIKPQLSGFYATNLPVLLPKLGVTRLVITGVATDICVLFTAADAAMRDYKIWIPADACAAETPSRHLSALELAQSALRAEIVATPELSLNDWMMTERER